jgi:hypothetical protein
MGATFAGGVFRKGVSLTGVEAAGGAFLMGAAFAGGTFLTGAGAGLLLTTAGALFAGVGAFLSFSFSFCAYMLPDDANSTAISAVPRQRAKSAFTIRRALIEFSSCRHGSRRGPAKPDR